MVTGPLERIPRRSWTRFLPVLLLVSLGGFFVGTRVFLIPAPATHPVTGRPIAGIATDADWLERAERQREEAPEQALELVGLTRGMSVADVGAGTGYMTTRIARLVGPTGKVYANDLQPAMLRRIERKVKEQELANVEIVPGTEDDTGLPSNAVDVVLLVDVYHELHHPQAILASIHRSLKPNGRLVLIEYRKEDPRVPIAATHRMSVAETRAEIESEAFAFDGVIDDLPRQHIIVFRKATRQQTWP